MILLKTLKSCLANKSFLIIGLLGSLVLILAQNFPILFWGDLQFGTFLSFDLALLDLDAPYLALFLVYFYDGITLSYDDTFIHKVSVALKSGPTQIYSHLEF